MGDNEQHGGVLNLGPFDPLGLIGSEGPIGPISPAGSVAVVTNLTASLTTAAGTLAASVTASLTAAVTVGPLGPIGPGDPGGPGGPIGPFAIPFPALLNVGYVGLGGNNISLADNLLCGSEILDDADISILGAVFDGVLGRF